MQTQKIAIEAVNTTPVEIVAILDRSGSMDTIKLDAIGGFNTFIDEQKQQDGEANLTVVLFDNQYEILQDRVNLKDAIKLDNKNYIPRGGTALFDAIGKTIATFRERHAKGEVQGGLICSILTDGEENSSKEFKTTDSIKKLITEAESELGWSFVFLAANQDAFAAGSNFGISGANTMSYAADSVGTRNAMKGASDYTTNYRSTFNKTAEQKSTA